MPAITEHKSNHPHRVSLDKALHLLDADDIWRDILTRKIIDREVLVDAWMEDSLVYVAVGARGIEGADGLGPQFGIALVDTKAELVLAIRLVRFESTGRLDEIVTLFESAGLARNVASIKGFKFDSSTISRSGIK